MISSLATTIADQITAIADQTTTIAELKQARQDDKASANASSDGLVPALAAVSVLAFARCCAALVLAVKLRRATSNSQGASSSFELTAGEDKC